MTLAAGLMPRDLCGPEVGGLPSSRTFTPASLWAHHSKHNPHNPISLWNQNTGLPTQCSQSKETVTWHNAFERCLFCTFTVGTWKSKCCLKSTSGPEDNASSGCLPFLPIFANPMSPFAAHLQSPHLLTFPDNPTGVWCDSFLFLCHFHSQN